MREFRLYLVKLCSRDKTALIVPPLKVGVYLKFEVYIMLFTDPT